MLAVEVVMLSEPGPRHARFSRTGVEKRSIPISTTLLAGYPRACPELVEGSNRFCETWGGNSRNVPKNEMCLLL